MTKTTGGQSLRIEVKSFGPTAIDLERVGCAVLESETVRQELGRSKFRLLSVAAIDPADDGRKSSRPRAADRFQALIYDYDGSRCLVAEGPIGDPGALSLTESAAQPPVIDEEFAEACTMLKAHAEFAEDLTSSRLTVYRPMPPLIDLQTDDGATRRIIAIGLFGSAGRRPREILGVDLGDGRLHRFDERAPGASRPANDSICGAPSSASQSTTTKGIAGQVWITVKQGNKTLWRFLAVRPSASSGLRGSGVELRYLDYLGKRVLYRAHVPILNVKYDGDACGPYRDWQYQEGEINAVGTDVAPGFRLCSSPAQTIFQTGSDAGNFLGVGIYVDGQEVVLVSEMEAGWYRYMSEWRLHSNGTIRPRFGFAATDSPCVCNVHHHHAYWRLDFDIVSAGGNRVEEFNDPPLVGASNWHRKRFEIARARDPSRKRKWRVSHVRSGASYEIRPRPEDGIAAKHPDWPYGRGDFWVLRYRGSEIDDGVNATSGSGTEARIGNWVNGESVDNQDIVIWYGAHFTHDVSHEDPATHGHVVGPDLVPVDWH